MADYDLTSLSVGFDLRLHDMITQIDVRPSLSVRHNRDRTTAEIAGSPEIVGGSLVRAGYRVAWQWGEMPPGYEARVVTLGDGSPALELRDPNDGSRARHQYVARYGGVLAHRRLPARGDLWRDQMAPPWWEPMRLNSLRAPHILLAWREACVEQPCSTWVHAEMTRHIAAWTPNGREVRWCQGGGVELQPPLDNWWHRTIDVESAHTWWYTQAGARPESAGQDNKVTDRSNASMGPGERGDDSTDGEPS